VIFGELKVCRETFSADFFLLIGEARKRFPCLTFCEPDIAKGLTFDNFDL
jgi:hypothetical protein